jgi:hypothetical protein
MTAASEVTPNSLRALRELTFSFARIASTAEPAAVREG